LYIKKNKPQCMGRKFDLRVYIVVDMLSHVYMYNDFLVRICRKKYKRTSKDKKIQLTNIAQGAEMIMFSKWDGIGSDKSIFDSVKTSVKSLAIILKKYKRKSHTFAFLGCDYIIDNDGKALLLEINDKPELGTNEEFSDIGNIQRRLINDFAKYFIEPIIVRSEYPMNKKNWMLI
jgi:hypothetical protein